jgi:hypothetical protein
MSMLTVKHQRSLLIGCTVALCLAHRMEMASDARTKLREKKEELEHEVCVT